MTTTARGRSRRLPVALFCAGLLFLAIAAGWWLIDRLSDTRTQTDPSAQSNVRAAANQSALAYKERADYVSPAPVAPGSMEEIERGQYLARVGNCAGCHTVRGGAAYAGGLALPTPFGAVYTSNLTPDARHGIGAWNADDFWHAMHEGRSRDGHLLTPAFPYTSYTAVERKDSDAIFAFLRTQAPVAAPAPAHELSFPFNTQAALWAWRTLYFEPAVYQADPARDAELNRGAYLVQGLGHCAACHSSRNALGAITSGSELNGGSIPQQGWYAPSLRSPAEAGLAGWSAEDAASLLRTGRVSHPGLDAGVQGPMAGVIFGSTQYLNDQDLHAMVAYLRSLAPVSHNKAEATAGDQIVASSAVMDAGARIYESSCAACHGKSGEGQAGRFPALAGNRALSIGESSNVVQSILHGGFLPATADNPRPYGMPPFGQTLDDESIAAVASYVRGSWGNTGPVVQWLDVVLQRQTNAR